MNLTHSLAQLQKDHVVLELECIDRMYLNAYVPKLTSEAGIAAFCRGYLGHRFASTKQAVAMTDAFVKAIRTFIEQEGLDWSASRRASARTTSCKRTSAAYQTRRRRLRRRRPGEDARAAHHPQGPARRRHHALDHVLHRHGQRLLLLLPGPGLRPLLPQVRLLLPLLGQALPQWP